MRERRLLHHVFEANRRLPSSVTVPPGDDLGAVRLPSWIDGAAAPEVLLGVDQVIDGRHVRLDLVGPVAVGRKAVCRSLSDIAAMAARPVCSLATAALPRTLEDATVQALFDAMRDAAAEHACPLIGGDIATLDSGPLVLTVTVLATPGPAGIIERSGARVGDGVYVTGAVGGSLEPDHAGHHLTFTPRIAEALALADMLGASLHAAIDLSDGLGVDAAHVAELSKVAIELDAAKLPCRGDVAWRNAVASGEDYELLFTASGPVPAEAAGCPVHRIGRVLEQAGSEPRVVVVDGPSRIDIAELGWEHR